MNMVFSQIPSINQECMRSVTHGQSAYWERKQTSRQIHRYQCPSVPHIYSKLVHFICFHPCKTAIQPDFLRLYPSSRRIADCDHFEKCGIFPFWSSVLGQILMQELTTQPSMKKRTLLSKVTFCDPLDACLMSLMWYVGVLTVQTMFLAQKIFRIILNTPARSSTIFTTK